MAHNNVSLVHKHSLVPVPCKFTYVTSHSPSPSNIQPSPARVTPAGNFSPHNNQPQLIPHVPIDPDADPILLDYSLSESLYSLESGYSKQG